MSDQPGIYQSVMGDDGADGFVDPFDAADEFDQMSEEDYNSLYSGEPLTGNAQIYDQVQSAPVQVNNPRQADRASDAGGPAGRVVRLAQSFVGTPYVWGGSSPSGFDCSGFVQYVYRKIGVNLPRVSYQQATAGKRIGLGGLRAGDLVAWDNSTRNNGADHIAIYIGGGMIAEAPRPGVPLRVRKLGAHESAWGVRVL